jgi:hypothetical protein
LLWALTTSGLGTWQLSFQQQLQLLLLQLWNGLRCWTLSTTVTSVTANVTAFKLTVSGHLDLDNNKTGQLSGSLPVARTGYSFSGSSQLSIFLQPLTYSLLPVPMSQFPKLFSCPLIATVTINMVLLPPSQLLLLCCCFHHLLVLLTCWATLRVVKIEVGKLGKAF